MLGLKTKYRYFKMHGITRVSNSDRVSNEMQLLWNIIVLSSVLAEWISTMSIIIIPCKVDFMHLINWILKIKEIKCC